MTIFILVRHARHSRIDATLCGRIEGVDLSVEGLRESNQLAAYLAREPVAAVYSSPIARARQTAAPIGGRLAQPVHVEEAFAEIDYGGWTGRSFAELSADAEWRRWNAERDSARPPGGESMAEAQARAVGGAARLGERHGEEAVVIVSHAEIIRALLLHWLELPLRAWQRLAVAPAALSRVAMDASGVSILSLNEVAR